MWSVFGPSRPDGGADGYVTSFDFADVPRPSACAYTFPPRPGDDARGLDPRPAWFYVTHGLAQWLTRAEMTAARVAGNRASGSGHEFALITDRPAPWAVGLLRTLMAYDHERSSNGARGFHPGDRIAFRFTSIHDDDVRYALGGSADDPDPASDDTRSLVFWRYLASHGTFTTATGSFELRVATAVSGAELKLAQATSTCHLLLLLDAAGVGQRTRPGRPCVTRSAGWRAAWDPISTLPFEDAKARLQDLATRWGFP
jgi:hypothetical protein